MFTLEGRAVPDEEPENGDSVARAPCVFCGRVIGHVNDFRDWRRDEYIGCVAGSLVGGEVQHFLYCNEPPCPEREAAEDAGQGVWDCSCEDYRAFDVIGERCHVCGRTRAEADVLFNLLYPEEDD